MKNKIKMTVDKNDSKLIFMFLGDIYLYILFYVIFFVCVKGVRYALKGIAQKKTFFIFSHL